MRKTYRGSCHCKAVCYQAEIDLDYGTTKCNCSVCSKSRHWSVYIKPQDLQILSGENVLKPYQFNARSIQHLFCRHCGVRLFAYINMQDKLGLEAGNFISVQVSALDDLEPEELLSAPIHYVNGCQNKWWQQPDIIEYL